MRLLGALCLAGAVLALLTCSLPSATPRRYAIVFGISAYYPSYPGPSQYDPNLAYPVADADGMAAMFAAAGFDQVVEMTDSTATKAKLEAEVAALAAEITASDLFVFYYSGHGIQDQSHEWIAPFGTVMPDGPTYYYTLDYNAAIRDDELAGILAPIKTSRKVVILDSCNSGGFIVNGAEVDRTPPTYELLLAPVTPALIGEAIQRYATLVSGGWPSGTGLRPVQGLVLAASGRDESSYETGAYGHGVFTYYLLEAPASGDLNRDGYVTTLEMFALATAGINRSWNLFTPSGGAPFEPHVSGGPLDFVLFRSRTSP